MNNKVIGTIAFLAGAAIGSLVTWKVLEPIYEQRLQEESASIKEAFSAIKSDETTASDSESVQEYADIVENHNYTNYKGAKNVDEPYVISPDEFGETGYEKVSLDYFSDGVLTDEMGEVIEDAEGTVGPDALNSFGEYEKDSVFVRDDVLKIDYEILANEETYSETYNTQPHPAEEE